MFECDSCLVENDTVYRHWGHCYTALHPPAMTYCGKKVYSWIHEYAIPQDCNFYMNGHVNPFDHLMDDIVQMPLCPKCIAARKAAEGRYGL